MFNHPKGSESIKRSNTTKFRKLVLKTYYIKKLLHNGRLNAQRHCD